MKTYVYNDTPHMNDDATYKSFKDVQGSEEWKNDKGRYCFISHSPLFCNTISHVVYTFDDFNDLFDKFSWNAKHVLLKVIKFNDSDSYLMKFTNDRIGNLDDEAKKYLQEHLGERSDQYNYWLVLGRAMHKDGSPITKEECIEREF